MIQGLIEGGGRRGWKEMRAVRGEKQRRVHVSKSDSGEVIFPQQRTKKKDGFV
jgi:hypothetical protein